MEQHSIPLQSGDALILVDIQNDFLPGGSLPASRGNEIIAPVNHLIHVFHSKGLPIFLSRDWHPANHCSFRANGGKWPPHCISGTYGATLSADLKVTKNAKVISKGTETKTESYSCFDQTRLHDQLQGLDSFRLFIAGLHTEYGIENAVKDALFLGYRVFLVKDAVRPLGSRDQELKALAEMVCSGCNLIRSYFIPDVQHLSHTDKEMGEAA